MKKLPLLKYLLGVLFAGVVITACDKFEEDVPPASMTTLQLHDDQYTTKKDQAVELKVLTNDTIGSTATLQYGQPVNGTIQHTNGAVFYVPKANFSGPDSLTYTACLGNYCATAMIRINVLPDSTAQCVTMVVDDSRTTWNHNDTIDVLYNDNLCGNANTTLTIVKQPTHGQASVYMGSLITYSPVQGYTGPDEITYTIQNSNGQSTAKVWLHLTPPPCVLMANMDTIYIKRRLGTADTVSINMAANDNICPNAGPVNIQLTSFTNYGSVHLIGTGLGTRAVYMTTAGKGLVDNFQYRICQGNQCSNGFVQIWLQ